jgi:hypothetical protein
LNGTSGINGTNGLAGTSGLNGSNGTSGISPIFNSGSYATTGSNQFLGNQSISGSLTITEAIIGDGNIKLQPDANDVRYLEVYNTAPQDTHITASGGYLYLGDDETYVNVNNDGSDTIYVRADSGLTIDADTKITGSLGITGSLKVTGLNPGFGQLGKIEVTGSVNASVAVNTPFVSASGVNALSYEFRPTGQLLISQTIPALAVSGSNLYFWDGTQWCQLNTCVPSTTTTTTAGTTTTTAAPTTTTTTTTIPKYQVQLCSGGTIYTIQKSDAPAPTSGSAYKISSVAEPSTFNGVDCWNYLGVSTGSVFTAATWGTPFYDCATCVGTTTTTAAPTSTTTTTSGTTTTTAGTTTTTTAGTTTTTTAAPTTTTTTTSGTTTTTTAAPTTTTTTSAGYYYYDLYQYTCSGGTCSYLAGAITGRSTTPLTTGNTVYYKNTDGYIYSPTTSAAGPTYTVNLDNTTSQNSICDTLCSTTTTTSGTTTTTAGTTTTTAGTTTTTTSGTTTTTAGTTTTTAGTTTTTTAGTTTTTAGTTTTTTAAPTSTTTTTSGTTTTTAGTTTTTAGTTTTTTDGTTTTTAGTTTTTAGTTTTTTDGTTTTTNSTTTTTQP